LKNYKNLQNWWLYPQTPYCLRRMELPPNPHSWPWAPEIRVSHYKFIKYRTRLLVTSIVPVQTFYSFILLRVNKKVLPLHNFSLPPKYFRWLRTCLVALSVSGNPVAVHPSLQCPSKHLRGRFHPMMVVFPDPF